MMYHVPSKECTTAACTLKREWNRWWWRRRPAMSVAARLRLTWAEAERLLAGSLRLGAPNRPKPAVRLQNQGGARAYEPALPMRAAPPHRRAVRALARPTCGRGGRCPAWARASPAAMCVCARARVCVCVPAHGGDGEGWWFVGGDLAAEEKRLVANWHAVQLGPILRDADESGLPRQRREAWQSKPRRHRASERQTDRQTRGPTHGLSRQLRKKN